MRVITGVRFSNVAAYHFSEPIIFDKVSPRLTARRLRNNIIRVRLWRGKKILMWEAVIRSNEFDRREFILIGDRDVRT